MCYYVPFVKSIVFRKLTMADFFNINKPKGIEKGGGGQSYIDFPISAVTVDNWNSFFKHINSTPESSGPSWKFKIKSLGVKKPDQTIIISQRRLASVSIRSQKLSSKTQNRVHAWNHEFTGFPIPKDSQKRNYISNLHIYIVNLDDKKYWAGWFQIDKPKSNWSINKTLNKMFTNNAGYLEFDKDVTFHSKNAKWPFRIKQNKLNVIPTTGVKNKRIKEEIFFDEDEALPQNIQPKIKKLITNIKIRNSKSTKKLKALYKNKCQISGTKYTFKKKNGDYYSEAHHLIPLGEGGFDSEHNIVILSPFIHRMMHYAKVDDFDLKNIKNNKLSIKINDKKYTITWKSGHAKIIRESLAS